MPRNFKAVYGPAGCRTDPWGGSTDQIGWSAVGTGEVIETFYAHSVNDKTALEVAQTPEAAAVTFEMVSLKIGDTYATNSGNIWGGTGTSNVLAHERTFRYKVNGVEMHICYPAVTAPNLLKIYQPISKSFQYSLLMVYHAQMI